MASCQPLATALDNGRVILCDRIADPWVRTPLLHLTLGPATTRLPKSLLVPPLPAQSSRDPCVLSLQNAFWFSLGCCTFFLIPNIIFAIRLTKHFRPIRNRLM